MRKKEIDGTGRIVIPKEIRTLLHWEGGDHILVRCDPETGEVILSKAETECMICKSKEKLIWIKDHMYLCENCAKRIQK